MRRTLAFLTAVAVLSLIPCERATLATAPQPAAAAARSVGPRTVGGDLTVLDPPSGATYDLSLFGVPDGLEVFDLGDAVDGQPLERILHVSGGLRPYQYISGALRPNLIATGDAPEFNPDFIALSAAGVVSGTLQVGGFVGEFFFDVNIVDASGTVLSVVYRINFVDEFSEPFRFAQDDLGDAQQGLNYAARIQALNGDLDLDTNASTARFSLVPDSADIGGQALERLEEIGLTLNADGTLYGRPLQGGTLTFTVHAEDALGATALSFDGGSDDQTFSLEIETLGTASSTFYADHCLLRGTLARNRRDSFSLRGTVDMGGQLLAQLAGTPITVRFGGGKYVSADPGGRPYGRTFRGILDARGAARVVVQDDPFTEAFEGFRFSALVRQNGRVSVNVSGADLFEAVNADTLIQEPIHNLIVEVAFGNALHCEAVSMPTQVTFSPYQLRYSLQGKGELGLPLAGIFQTSAVLGRDEGTFEGNRGNNWLVHFAAAPRFGIDGSDLSGASNATFRFGRNYDSSQSVDLDNLFHEEAVTLNTDRPVFRFARPKNDPGRVLIVMLHTILYRHSVRTVLLREDQTGIPQAQSSAEADVLQFELQAGSANGACSRPLFPFGKRWSHLP
ncbi:MAG: hypothetical protein M5U26_16680 [Planctomycetota bacterium]|nr:hypothetical protein [Planctomycetota bacterium]